MKIIFLLSFITIVSCAKTHQQRVACSNPEFSVELLFIVDDISVYRFYDSGYPHYFCNKGSTLSNKVHRQYVHNKNGGYYITYNTPEEIETH